MTDETRTEGKLIQLRPDQPPEEVRHFSDVSYEIELDAEPEPGPPVHVDPPPPVPDLRPAIPVQWRTREGRRTEVERHWLLLRHRAAVHGLRAPLYLALAVMWAVVGAFRLLLRQLRWWWMTEQHSLRSDAVKAGDSREWMRLHKEAKDTRRVRGLVLLGELAALTIACVLLAAKFPWWASVAVILAAVPLLAHHGRPPDKPIITRAVVAPRFRRLSADIVLRAYYAAGLGHPDKPDQQVTFGSPMSRDGDGSRVLVDLPYGKGLKEAVEAKDRIASGLDVTESQVFIHRDPTSHRRHTLWVADRDPLAVPVGRTPLLACRQTDIWKPAPMGLDERGKLVTVPMLWHSILVSALPRAGKTFSARMLALYCALDPYVKLDVFDFKGSPDWRKFALVADTFAFGLTPTRDGMPLEIFGNTLEEIKRDAQDRYHRLSELPASVCPEGKLTRQIARDPRFGMPVRVLVLEEFQEVYDLGDASKEVASLLAYLIKVAPGAGIILIASTQRPSGVGSGTVARQFTGFRDNFPIRFGLRTSSWQVSELCLGAGAYSEGLDTSTLLPQYKGVGILRGASDASPTVRTYLADGQDAEKILTAARTMRQRAGTLSGMAVGEDRSRPDRNVLGDVLSVFGDDRGLQWADLAERLARVFPDRWADATADAVSAQVRGLGVPGSQVWAKGSNQQGCKRMDVESRVSA